MLRVSPPSYLLSRWVFLRLLGLIHLVAFVSLGVQVTGLVCADGILPAGVYLDRLRDSYGGPMAALVAPFPGDVSLRHHQDRER